MIEVISGELELRPLLTIIVQKACELLGAQRGSIGLVDEERDLVRIEAAYNMPPEELGSVARRGQGLAGAVYATASPVMLGRYGDVAAPILKGLDDDVVVGMPIKWRGKVIGTFGIGSGPPRRFGREDLETLELFARHAAIAINNARSYEREKRRALRLRAANVIAESALERNPARIVAIAETTVLTALDLRCRVLKKSEAAPEGALLFPLRAEVGEYDRLAVLDPETTTAEDRQALAALASQIGLALERASLFAELQRQLDEISLLYETSRRVSTAIDLKSVVGAYLAYVAACDRFRCDIGLIETDDNGEECLSIIGRWSPSYGVSFEPARYTAGEIGVNVSLREFSLIRTADAHSDPDVPDGVRRILAQAGGAALAAFPLIVQGERIGVIVLTHVEPHEWTEQEIRPYRTTGALLASVIKNRLDHRRLVKKDQHLAALAERRRLARELHDSVSQLIFSMTLIAQSIGAGFRKSPEEGEARVARLLDIAQLARAEMKALLLELKDPEGEEAASLAAVARREGLAAALARHRRIAAPAGVDIALALDGADRLKPAQAETCLRVAQEAIANAARHGGADRIEIALIEEKGESVFAVDDNGRGIDPGGAPDSSSSTRIGLAGMQARAVEAGGRFAARDSRLGGLRVEVRFPLQ
ncbi:GAF domain-containing sensor histidine kinase [Amphiplicatus metriothermophilus]|uniref:GAF domain-containing protein n=1 Tax=Amphiplicatus metriothermophilus TaxID=1519374 RepID=A0A239PSM7_9PROT|nr:GAF domain-containing protein [Amphiplicatus metriothermophilus]MBB5519225.1 signal transduction histidine kinase [Amphiplicatus metriothermophilus]SNT73294.1 GAF domain-containing protein [Amphiplicatus metriothermophilus]